MPALEAHQSDAPEEPTCGCKGVRYCAACISSDRVKNLRLAPTAELSQYSSWAKYVYCHQCKSAFDVTASLRGTDDSIADSDEIFNLAANCKHIASDCDTEREP
uniref:Uncharacterized protein n=1 Tax=Plectus sambesii TaxID=2011161 RepID=A0A914VAX9_9BILA